MGRPCWLLLVYLVFISLCVVWLPSWNVCIVVWERVLRWVDWSPLMLMFEYPRDVIRLLLWWILCYCLGCDEDSFFLCFLFFEGECVRVSPRLLLWTCRCSLVTVWLSFLAFSLSGLRPCFWLIDLGWMWDIGISNETVGGNHRLLLGSQAHLLLETYTVFKSPK